MPGLLRQKRPFTTFATPSKLCLAGHFPMPETTRRSRRCFRLRSGTTALGSRLSSGMVNCTTPIRPRSYRRRGNCLRDYSRQTADDRGPTGQLDPIAVRIEDHRYPRHISKCHRRKALAHALAPQIIMDRVDIGDLQGDVAPAGCLTRRIDGRGAVFLQQNEAVSQPKGRTARPGLFGEAEDVAIEPAMFAETADPHHDG